MSEGSYGTERWVGHFEGRAREVDTASFAQIMEGKYLDKSLEEALSFIKILEGEASSLKDEVVATSAQYFKREKRHATFFYLNLDLIWMELFQVGWDARIVDDE